MPLTYLHIPCYYKTITLLDDNADKLKGRFMSLSAYPANFIRTTSELENQSSTNPLNVNIYSWNLPTDMNHDWRRLIFQQGFHSNTEEILHQFNYNFIRKEPFLSQLQQLKTGQYLSM